MDWLVLAVIDNVTDIKDDAAVLVGERAIRQHLHGAEFDVDALAGEGIDFFPSQGVPVSGWL